MNYPNVETKLQAADEYIAHLSEEVELNARERSVWQKIMDFIADLLGRKADNRSKAASIVGKETLSRKDIAELVRLSYAEYLQRNGSEEAINEDAPEASTIRSRTVEEINNEFNEQLQQQIDGTLPKGHIYQLGSPGSILRSTGIPNIPMQLNAARLDAKATSYGHDFDIKEIKDLVKALDNPVAVFAYGDKAKAQNIIVEIQHNGANFVVGLSIRPSVKGQVLDVNSIRNVFPKKNAEWLNWISQGKALYLDKEKIQTLIDQQRTNLADVEYLDLDSVAKIVENFENPKVSEENSRLRIVYHGSGAEFDKFNHAFMGTGEGNQAYGWGTYVTEVDEIGRGYAEASGNVPLYKGMSMEDTWAANLPNGDAVHHVMNMMVTHNLPFAEAAKKVHGIATKMGNKKLANDVSKLSAEDFTTKGRNLYSVDIPDDNGSNYLHWDRRGGTTLQERIGDGLAAIGFEMKPDMNHLAYAREGKNVVLNSNATGADWYAELSDALGGDKEASQFLNGIGIVGISYPAQARSGGRVDGARNYVIFNEADAEIVEHIRFRTLPNERLRKLDEGETCNIERVFTQQKMFNFSSGEKIESYEDVAYIFRSLEDEAVENAFVALVKNGKPTIVHLGMGTATQSTVDQQAVIVAVERIKPDAVYLVHNHPSGNLKASRQDAMLLDSMKKAYGDIVKDGIIINLRSGKYSVFNEEGRKIEEATPNAPEKVTAAKTYSFSKRVFDKDFNVEELMHVTGSDAADAYAREHGLVAALTSSQRLGERGKLSLLIISQGSKIVGNVFLNHTEVLPSNLGNISKEIAYYVSAMGGQAGILYGRFGINETRHLGGAVNRASAGSVRMLDAISMTEFGGYVSALDEGVMEETPSYGKGETRFRVSNDNQEIFVSNAQRAVEGIKQEKGTPQQWLAMIEKNGGLKAGEDKWMGLSDWLKGMDKKSVTKQEILDFIGENKIQIEEVTYGEEAGGYSEEKLDEFNAEYEELIWEGEEETGSIYANDWADYAYEAMADRYGDDFRNAFDTEGIGTGSRLVPHYYYDGSLSEEAKQFVGEEGANDNEINSTRLEYTTEGLDNKQEIALTVPTIEPWNLSDDIHFGDAGGGRAVAWIRFGEANDADGNAVLVIDEIQSKRHQEGREKGYNNPRVIQILDRMNEIQVDLYSPYGVPEEVHAEKKALQEELEAAFESENPQMKKVTEQIKEKEARLGELNREKAEKENDEKVEMLKLQDRQLETRNVREYDYYEQEINNIKEAQERRDDEIDELRSSIRNLNEEYSHYYNTELRNARTGVMPAPFEKNWHELAMKRMLRYAAENGFDKVAWTTGAQQAERYNMSKVVESIECNRVGKNGNKSFVLKGVDYNVISNNEGVVVAGPEEFKGKQLSEVVGVSLADKMLGMEEGGVLNNTDLRIGGEGMKGFYDKMLPSFVQKYTKKWGAKVGEVELPHLEEGAQKMWSVDVTPEMKESVMEGQTMFRVTDDIEDANARFN
ncbi:MAG: hypothetical protein J6V61_03335, partial [Bacteroidaceae bacterium]|nr:hypothetical protein [Bacteroidaceae bacterium]